LFGPLSPITLIVARRRRLERFAASTSRSLRRRACSSACPRVGQGLLLGLVPGVQLDGVHAQADRVFLVLPLRFGSCLPFGRSLEQAKPRLQLRLGKVAG
jgi:hypothetical protein